MNIAINGFGRIGRNFFRAAKGTNLMSDLRGALMGAKVTDADEIKATWDKVTASLNMLSVDYDDFSDLTALAPVGQEPLYQLDADIFQLYFSIFY